MCGFVGVLDTGGKPIDVATLVAMTDAQRHRGPDDQGFHLFSLARGAGTPVARDGGGGAGGFEGGLGFNRLSIIDVSAAGHQPMASADGSVVLVFNGEIYNAADERPRLVARGATFAGHSDTEVLLRLYELDGFDAMLARLNGMFALCIVDLRLGRVLLARDRMGIKPLYLAEQGRKIWFGSEVKSFLADPDFTTALDGARLDEFLTFRYCGQTGHLLRDVRQVPPGHAVEIARDGLRLRPYWSIPDVPSALPSSPRQSSALLRRELELSVRRQLVSDVELGCQLSGGIDSSLVNLLGARLHHAGGMKAFSVILDDARFSEEPWIDEAVRLTGVEGHKFRLEAPFFVDNLRAATWHLDSPLNHPSSLGLYFLAKHASEQVTVLLSGEGADELLGGYARFVYARLRPWLRPALPLAARLPRLGPRIDHRLGPGGRDAVDWWIMASAELDERRLQALRPEARLGPVLEERRGWFAEGHGDYLSNCLKYEMRTYLPDLLLRQDKMTMAFSVENRVPFLDHTLVERVRREVPVGDLVHLRPHLRSSLARNTKVALKRVAEGYFGAPFTFRPKAGFGIPLKQFFADRAFATLMEDSLLPSLRRRGILAAAATERLWRDLPRLDATDLEALWVAASFELWAQRFLDRAAS